MLVLNMDEGVELLTHVTDIVQSSYDLGIRVCSSRLSRSSLAAFCHCMCSQQSKSKVSWQTARRIIQKNDVVRKKMIGESPLPDIG